MLGSIKLYTKSPEKSSLTVYFCVRILHDTFFQLPEFFFSFWSLTARFLYNFIHTEVQSFFRRKITQGCTAIHPQGDSIQEHHFKIQKTADKLTSHRVCFVDFNHFVASLNSSLIASVLFTASTENINWTACFLLSFCFL